MNEEVQRNDMIDAASAPTARPNRRMRRTVVLVCAIASIAVSCLALSASPASAVGCWGDWCSGRDPAAMGCDRDARTVVHARIPGTYTNIELRWSPTCKTNWARVHVSYGNGYPGSLRAVQQTGYTQAGVVNSNGTYAWTRMIYSPNLCVRAVWQGPPGSVGTSCA